MHKELDNVLARGLAAVGLAGVALIHLLDLSFDPAYKALLYAGLIVGSTGVAAALIQRNDRRAWLAAFALPLGAIAGYVISRTIGLPGGANDIGNWSEPLGIASLYVEGLLVALSASVLIRQPRALPRAAAAGVLYGL